MWLKTSLVLCVLVGSSLIESEAKTDFSLWKEMMMSCSENIGKTQKVILIFDRMTTSSSMYLTGIEPDSSPGTIFSLDNIAGQDGLFDPKIKNSILKLKKGSFVYTEWRVEEVDVRKNDTSKNKKPRIKCFNILDSIRPPTQAEAKEFLKYSKNK